MNMYSLVVRALPGKMDRVKEQLLTIPGVELHQEHEGRLIVTVEDVPGYRTSEALTAIQSFEGIVSTTLAYEYCDDELAVAPSQQE
ncbi:chaperone NapD [Chitinibacter sp. S2-10]|uniref:chaperone NapD n=1 Tax=Chitinibacter sp. S2-10 TaxID=3373597 RepID=UPI00397780B8